VAAEAHIALRKVGKSYETVAGGCAALRGIDLEIERGAFVAIRGKSGSGKSTLLNLIGGIDRPSEGEIRIGGELVHQESEEALALWRGRSVGIVFQFFQLLPTLTTAENVMLPMDFANLRPPKERRARALELLERVGIADQADKLPSTLSGGQQQRAAIARAMANAPAVVIADEPTGNLDTSTASAVLDLLAEMASGGTTVLIATHERDIDQRVDRMIELRDGQLPADSLR